MSRPPWSATVTGLIDPVGVMMPALITAPALPAGAEADVVPAAGALDVLLLQASRIDPSTGAAMPTTVARRMKSRRESRPAANSSMM